jgi:hypothetical protein
VAEIKIEIDGAMLVLKDRLHRLVFAGELAAKDFELAFEEEVTVRLKADGRTLNRLEKLNGRVGEAIRAYKDSKVTDSPETPTTLG